jgi:hypothetical protein
MATSNDFREDELVSLRTEFDEEAQFPRVGGRLRLAHEANDKLSIQTEVIRMEDALSVVKATATTLKGDFCGFGTASVQRDARLADSLLELAETRSIARALRFAGFGVEFCSAEEVSHLPLSEPATGKTPGKTLRVVTSDAETERKPETKVPVQAKHSGNGNNGGKATQAQCRALYALAKKAQLSSEEKTGILAPFNADRLEDLSIADASRLIQQLQSSASA